jgi:Plant protein of unknown function
VFVFLASILKLCCRRNRKSTNGGAPRTIPSATELIEAGTKFKCKKSENILDIRFRNGILEIPFISIEETRRSAYWNVVSFEQCFTKHNMHLPQWKRKWGLIDLRWNAPKSWGLQMSFCYSPLISGSDAWWRSFAKWRSSIATEKNMNCGLNIFGFRRAIMKIPKYISLYFNQINELTA